MTDNLTVLKLIAEFSSTTKIVSFAMGTEGQFSRILCPLAGGYFTYASVGEGKESAEGQLTVNALKRNLQVDKMISNISGKTKICALIGDPVEHTMSPAMHNAAFQKLGLDYAYIPFRVKPDQLLAAVAGLKALNVRGFNVTIPHKVAIILVIG